MISLPDHIPDLRRLNVYRAVLVMMMITIGLRLWYLQLVRAPELTAMSQAQSVRTIRRVAPRGAIVDSKGRVIATNRFKFVVSISPDDAKKHPETLQSLAPLLKTDEETLKAKVFPIAITKAGKVVQLNHPYDPVPLDRDIGIDVLSQIEEQHLNLPGALVTRDPVRYYKDGIVCSHILGYTGLISEDQLGGPDFETYHGGDFVGKDGLEAHYEQELRGIDGGDNFTVDARGRMLRKLGEKKPQAGHTLKLAMDLDLQRKAYELLKEQYDGKNRRHPGTHTGAIVALDPNNGEVLAMVSMPGYDANRYTADYNQNLANLWRPLFNRATSAAMPCGSPFKLVSAAAGLETGKLSQWTTHNCSGAMRLGRAKFKCDEAHGTIAFENAIGASCNVYFYNVGQSVGPQTLADWADRFGLGKKTGIDLSERAGRVPSPARRKARAKRRQDANWYPGETLNMSIGQGDLQITPLQLANYVAALANGGTLWKPRLVHAIIDPSAPTDQQEQVLQPEENGKLGLRPENRQLIVSGMRHALFPGGTASGIAIPGLDIAGKTGTVEIGNTHQRNSMFVCFAPIDHPKIALAVMIEGGGFGAETAAPIARQMLAAYFHIKVDPITYGAAQD